MIGGGGKGGAVLALGMLKTPALGRFFFTTIGDFAPVGSGGLDGGAVLGIGLLTSGIPRPTNKNEKLFKYKCYSHNPIFDMYR